MEKYNNLRKKLHLFVDTLQDSQMEFLDAKVKELLPEIHKLSERSYSSPAQSVNTRPANEMEDGLDFYHGRNL